MGEILADRGIRIQYACPMVTKFHILLHNPADVSCMVLCLSPEGLLIFYFAEKGRKFLKNYQ